MLDDYIRHVSRIEICFFSIVIKIFWEIEAVFGGVRACIRKIFNSLMLISNILQQYLIYFLTLPHLPFIVSSCQHFESDPPIPLQSVSSVSILAQTPHPPKPADVILERSLIGIVFKDVSSMFLNE